jgi:glycine cleavage system H protein
MFFSPMIDQLRGLVLPCQKSGSAVMKLFSEEHQWVELADGSGTVGLSAYAVDEMGEINFIDLPQVGTVLSQGEAMCVVESSKAATDVCAPISGTIIEVNTKLESDTTLLNTSAEGDGWICKLGEIDESELDVLLTEEQYESFTADSMDGVS